MSLAARHALTAGGVRKDPYFANVSLLTNSANNLSFFDGSANNSAITRAAVVTPSLNSPFSGGVGGSQYFAAPLGVSYLSIPNNSGTIMDSADFSAECFVWFSDLATYTRAQVLSKGGQAGVSFDNWGIEIQSGRFISSIGLTNVSTAGTTILTLTSTTSPSNGVWYHVAVVKTGTTYSLYVNGTREATTTNATVPGDPRGNGLLIGGQLGQTGNFCMYGFVSNVRVCKTTTPYSASSSTITVPTAPLTAISGTSLLVTGTAQGMFDNSVSVDQGPNALAVTATNAPLYSGLSPFNSKGYYGSWALVSASSQSLTVVTNAAFTYASADFTIECWVRFSAIGAAQYILDQRNAGTANAIIPTLYLSAAGTLRYFVSNADRITGGTTLVANTWYHVAVCRSITSTKIFLNGAQEGSTYTDANNYAASRLVIGAEADTASNYLGGYITNIRTSKGFARYTTAFTPPVAPFSMDANTTILMRCDTGGFYDRGPNGNPQSSTGTTAVSTQQTKYTGAARSYAATSYQSALDATNEQLGAGDYTIEGWVYRSAAGVLHSLICKGAAATGWLVQINASNQLVFTVTASAIITTTATIGATTWTHWAVTRSGSTVRSFVGGVLDNTATDSTNFTQTNALLIGCDRSNANGLNGYQQDVRLTKGVARYTATFTPPAALFPTA